MLIATASRNLQHAERQTETACASFKFWIHNLRNMRVAHLRHLRARPPGAHSQKFIGNPTARARKMKIKLNFPKGTHINPKAKSVDTPNGNGTRTSRDCQMERWSDGRAKERWRQMKICSLLLPKANILCSKKYHKYLIFTFHNVACPAAPSPPPRLGGCLLQLSYVVLRGAGCRQKLISFNDYVLKLI